MRRFDERKRKCLEQTDGIIDKEILMPDKFRARVESLLRSRPLVEEAVRDMLEAGMIKRSVSPWHCFCVDFRKLNSVSKPLVPLIDDILALVGKYFSTLDLRSG